MKYFVLFLFFAVLGMNDVKAQEPGAGFYPTCFKVQNMQAFTFAHDRVRITFDIIAPSSGSGFAQVRTVKGRILKNIFVDGNASISTVVDIVPEDASHPNSDGSYQYYFECGVETDQCESEYDGCNVPVGGDNP